MGYTTVQAVVLIIIAVLSLGISVIGSLKYVVTYSEKSEAWTTLIPRIFLWLSMLIIFLIPQLIPIDVSITYAFPSLTFMSVVW